MLGVAVSHIVGMHPADSYDLLGRLVRSETPDGGEELIVLDALGQVRRTQRNGVKGVVHDFDSTGRLVATQSARRN